MLIPSLIEDNRTRTPKWELIHGSMRPIHGGEGCNGEIKVVMGGFCEDGVLCGVLKPIIAVQVTSVIGENTYFPKSKKKKIINILKQT